MAAHEIASKRDADAKKAREKRDRDKSDLAKQRWAAVCHSSNGQRPLTRQASQRRPRESQSGEGQGRRQGRAQSVDSIAYLDPPRLGLTTMHHHDSQSSSSRLLAAGAGALPELVALRAAVNGAIVDQSALELAAAGFGLFPPDES